MAERRLWFVRRNGEVKGPFLTAQISRNILLGRLNAEDEVSLDEVNWQKIAKRRELIPDVMLEEPVDQKQLEIAKIQVDERISEKRRKKQNNVQDMAEERRGHCSLAGAAQAREPALLCCCECCHICFARRRHGRLFQLCCYR